MRTDLSHYQLLTPVCGLAYQTMETKDFLPQGRSGQSKACARTRALGVREETLPRSRQRPRGLSGGTEERLCLSPRLGRTPEVRLWDRREAGRPGEVWAARAEQRLGSGRWPGAPDPRGWEQWLGQRGLACCPRSSQFSFPARIFPGSPHSLPLRRPILSAGPQTAHSFMLISSRRLRVHVLTARRGPGPGTGAMRKGGSGGLPGGPGPASGDQRAPGWEGGVAPQAQSPPGPS